MSPLFKQQLPFKSLCVLGVKISQENGDVGV